MRKKQGREQGNEVKGELSQSQNAGSVKTKSDRRSLIRIICLSAILLAFFVSVAFVLSDMGIKKPVSDKEPSPDTVYSVVADNVSAMAPYGDNGVAVLTDTAVRYFDAFGNSVSSTECSFANPVMRTAGSNLILFDRGAYSLRIEKKGEIFAELTFDSLITAGAVSKSGSYAYVLNDCEGFQSHLYVYGKNGKKNFEWGSSADYIVDVALSPDGKKVCAALLGGNNAEIFSKIILFGVNSEKPVFDVSLPATAVYSVAFVSGRSVAAYTDRGVYLINSKGELNPVQEYSVTEMKLSANLTYGLGATAINRYGDDKNVLFTVFSKKYGVSSAREYTEPAKTVNVSKKYAAIVFPDRIEVYNDRDILIKEIAVEDVCISSVISGRYIFALFSDGIRAFRLV